MTEITKQFKKALNITTKNKISVFNIVNEQISNLFEEALISILRDPRCRHSNLEVNFIGYHKIHENIFTDDKYHQLFLQHKPAFAEEKQISGQITMILKLIKNEAIRRQEIMNASGLSITEYNKTTKNKISNSVLIVTDIDLLKNKLPHVATLLDEIISLVKNTNITLLTTSQTPLSSSPIIFNKNI